MKKILLLSMAIFFCAYVGAQKKAKPLKEAQSALNDEKLVEAWKQIRLACADSLTQNDPKTWYTKGKIAQAIALSKDSTLKDQFNKAAEQLKDTTFNSVIENPVVEAYNDYEKSVQIDPKKKYKNEIDILYFTSFSNLATVKALEAFNNKKYDKAFDLFDLNYKIESNPIFKSIDTINMYNCGLAAINAKKFDKAVEYLGKVVSYNFGGGNTYSLLKTAYLGKGDSTNALITLKKGFEKYPNELQIMIDLVNYYMVAGESAEALNYLKIAKAKEPNNKSFYFAEGVLYEKMKNLDSAVISYTRTTEIDPKYFDGFYYIGRIYYNKAVEINNQASSEKDDAKYNELQKQRDDLFKQSIPFFEKAHAIDAHDKDCAETLKSLYFRFDLKDKSASLKQEMGW